MNVASVWDLPVLFIVENNGYGLSTPVSEQYRCESIVDRAVGYGMAGVRIDGNDLLRVKDTVRASAAYAREYRRPVLVECMTFRMRGHEEASGVAYVPKELREAWADRDPIRQFEARLVTEFGIASDALGAVRTELEQFIAQEIDRGFADIPILSTVSAEIADVYPERVVVKETVDGSSENRTVRFIDAIKEALTEALVQDPSLVYMGQDIAEYGGAFKVTEGLVARFGRERIRNTPLCESAILGAALGMSIAGGRSMVEMQFADFVSSGFTQIVNNLAKTHYRWGAPARVVIRMPTGAGSGAGPFHSQSNEAWFTHTPGLYVAYPAMPFDAKGLLLTALSEEAPVLFFEHKGLYRRVSGLVPEGYYRIPFGEAKVVVPGDEFAIITYGMGVHWALEWAQQHPQRSAYILDLRTLCPLDYQAIRAAVEHTGRVLVLHEDTLLGGIGGDIAAWIGEHCFEHLDAPVIRVASLDTPVPFNAGLEAAFLAKSRLNGAVERLVSY
jgi:2-oxoisovalerate dehydrogenase E1 component